MTEADVFRRLNQLADTAVDDFRKLAAEIDTVCREPARTVLTAWYGNTARPVSCAFVCANLKELAVGEMLGRAESVAPAPRVQLMEMVTTQQLAFRELLLTALEPLLKNFTPIDAANTVGGLRVRDAAYLLARKIVPLSDVDAGKFSNEEQFNTLEESQRDGEIDEWLKSASWLMVFPEPL
jgi:hypothetical protein